MERENVIEITSKAPARKHRDLDLSSEIARAVEKQPGDRIKCRRVAGKMYRCNWFSPEKAGEGQALGFMETYHIRQSRFLRAEKVGGRLIIVDLT